MSHYIGMFTVRGHDGTQQSVCGQFIYPAEHSTEPTCATCCDFLERGVPDVPVTSVRVQQRVTLASLGVSILTDWSSSRATADMGETGILVVTAMNGTELKTFLPEEWETVSVIGEDGYEVFRVRNDVAWQSHVASRKLRRRSA